MISDVATTLVDRVRHGAGLGVGLLAFILVLGGCDAVTDDDLGDATPQTPSVAGYVSQVRALSALNTAVQGAGDLSVDLANEQITLFAPVNDRRWRPNSGSVGRRCLRRSTRTSLRRRARRD